MLQVGDIIKINQYNMDIAKATYIVMTSDLYVKHLSTDKLNGFPEWFSIVIDDVKDTKSLNLDNEVWFTTTTHNSTVLSFEKNNDNSIIVS